MNKDTYIKQLEEENLKLVEELQDKEESNQTFIKREVMFIDVQNKLYVETITLKNQVNGLIEIISDIKSALDKLPDLSVFPVDGYEITDSEIELMEQSKRNPKKPNKKSNPKKSQKPTKNQPTTQELMEDAIKGFDELFGCEYDDAKKPQVMDAIGRVVKEDAKSAIEAADGTCGPFFNDDADDEERVDIVLGLDKPL